MSQMKVLMFPSEVTSFEGLKTAITQVTSEVDKKTQAFKEEEQVVTGTVRGRLIH